MQWSDITATESAALKQFCTDTMANMGPAYIAAGGTTPGKILDVILGGSWANGTAYPMSDFDLFFVSDINRPYVINPDPTKLNKGLYLQFMVLNQRNYPALNRVLDCNLRPANAYFDVAGNTTFGFSLLTGKNYASVRDLIADYGAALPSASSASGVS